MMKTHQRYALVWQECGPDSHISARFSVPGFEGFLPFFIWGNELDALENKENVELREELLLKGILYGLYERKHQPDPWLAEKDEETFLFLLDRFAHVFEGDDLEKMILNTAYNAREINGSKASRIMLETGKDLLPRSSRIKSDLVLDLWAVLSESGQNNEFLQEILDLVEQIDLAQISPGGREAVCYYGLCASVFLDRDINEYLPKYIYPNVSSPLLKQNILMLLKNKCSITPADLRIS